MKDEDYDDEFGNQINKADLAVDEASRAVTLALGLAYRQGKGDDKSATLDIAGQLERVQNALQRLLTVPDEHDTATGGPHFDEPVPGASGR